MIREFISAVTVMAAAGGGTSLLAKCPVTEGATVVVKALVGDLRVDTSGRDATTALSRFRRTAEELPNSRAMRPIRARFEARCSGKS